jgi:hypothetical protein
MIKFINKSTSKVAMAVIIGGIALAHPAYASDSSAEQKSGATTRHHSGVDRVEIRISTLHSKLKITSEQEPQWKEVAKVMRENEASIHKLVEARHGNEDASAVDDLKSYEDIADAHADGLKKLIPVFQTFYDSLSDNQKKNADSLFGKFEGHSRHKG